jgi:hypothetical protein
MIQAMAWKPGLVSPGPGLTDTVVAGFNPCPRPVYFIPSSLES